MAACEYPLSGDDFITITELRANPPLWYGYVDNDPPDRGADSMLELDPFTLPVRQSHVNCFQECPRKFLFKYRFGLVPKSWVNTPAADVGVFAHIFYTSWLEGVTDEVAMKRATDEADMITLAYEQATKGPLAQDPASFRVSIEKRLLQARAMVDVYKDITVRDTTKRVIHVEEEVVVTSPHLRTKIGGRIDAILEDVKTGALWLYDFKTTIESLHEFQATLRWSPQVWLYRALVTAKYPDRAVAGFIHPMMKRPQIVMSGEDRDFELYEHTFTKGKRKGETEMRKTFTNENPRYENYLARVRRKILAQGEYQLEAADRIKDPWVLTSHLHFHGGNGIGSMEFQALIHQVAKASKAGTQLWRYPRANKNVCMPLKGSPCEFLRFCSKASAEWKHERKNHYVQVRLDKELSK